jgi:hypothetical protein
VVTHESEEPRCERLAVEAVLRKRLEDLEKDVLAGVFGVVVVLEGFEEVAVDVGKVLVIEAVAGSSVTRLSPSDEIAADRSGGFDICQALVDGCATRQCLPTTFLSPTPWPV